jgi:dolichol kinase
LYSEWLGEAEGANVNYSDVINGVLLVAYNLFIIHYVSRRIGERFGTYMARKAIHILSAGVSVLLARVIFSDWLAPLLVGSLIVIYTVAGHFWKTHSWFQIRANYADVYFTVACTALLVVFWNYNVWIGVLSALFVAWGDGLTGIVRSIVYGKRNKGLWGTAAMFAACMALAFFMNGRVGYIAFVAAAFASIAEKFEQINDNISIPIGSAIIMVLPALL